MSKIILFCICMLVGTLDDAHSKGWRGLIPLHSSCADVKRMLGVARCENVNKLEGETVNISYSEKPCADGWNVPKGTVIDITVIPKRKPSLTDLNLDMNKYQKVVVEPYDQPATTGYWNAEEGVSLEIRADGKVESISYVPTAKDSHRRYPNSLANRPVSPGDPGGITKFDEYGYLSLKEEHKRLDDFATQLQIDTATNGYILGYAGRRYRPGEIEALIERAKTYLIAKRGIDRSRIVTMNAGHQDDLVVELFAARTGGAPPSPRPTVCESEAQIIKTTKHRRSRRL